MISRIKTKKEVSKEKKKNQLIVGFLLVVLMVLSTLGFSFLSSDSTSSSVKIQENGLEFTRQGYYWTTNLQSQEYYFQYLPSQVSNIQIEGSYSIQDYSNKELYFINSNEATSQILVNLGRYTSRYQEACLDGFPCESNNPLKTCEDNLIIFEQGNETKIYKEDNCVYLVGDSLRASDALIYKLLNII